MAVNTLVTGLIAFKILTVFLEVKRVKPEATSIERTLGSLSLTAGTQLQHIIFIIIESGMALFAIHLVRVVITSLIQLQPGQMPPSLIIAMDLVIFIHQMFNVTIKFSLFIHFLCFYFFSN